VCDQHLQSTRRIPHDSLAERFIEHRRVEVDEQQVSL
jgi:hypothetical protein